uniref:Rieske domain-containing protein n=1 Tax=Palpitomonas bilix TaxID=652834 RepID=A0A7S3D461_9EUKA|mmetsp:Transcript_21156/g.55000  ORF Transcript_21156/g.55000 Transcript_21156/m.55000 type:complete len:247 (+) Transcript_21156:56-796(+)
MSSPPSPLSPHPGIAVTSVDELKKRGGRRCLTVENRNITVILVADNDVRCMDSYCYHMGGKIGEEGDIEDYGGEKVVRCPSHHHRISLQTGGVVSTDLDGNMNITQPKQQIHTVDIGKDGSIYVTVNSSSGLESDAYNAADAKEDEQTPAPNDIAAIMRQRRRRLLVAKRKRESISVSADDVSDKNGKRSPSPTLSSSLAPRSLSPRLSPISKESDENANREKRRAVSPSASVVQTSIRHFFSAKS